MFPSGVATRCVDSLPRLLFYIYSVFTVEYQYKSLFRSLFPHRLLKEGGWCALCNELLSQ